MEINDDSPWKWFFSRPEGVTYEPPAEEGAVAYFLNTANNGETELQQVSAFIALLHMGVRLKIMVAEE